MIQECPICRLVVGHGLFPGIRVAGLDPLVIDPAGGRRRLKHYHPVPGVVAEEFVLMPGGENPFHLVAESPVPLADIGARRDLRPVRCFVGHVVVLREQGPEPSPVRVASQDFGLPDGSARVCHELASHRVVDKEQVHRTGGFGFRIGREVEFSDVHVPCVQKRCRE